MGKNVDEPVNLWVGYLDNIEREYRECPDDYLRCDTISRCLHPSSTMLVKGYWDNLKQHSWFIDRMLIVRDGKIGNPYAEFYQGLSPVTVGHMHHFHTIQQRLDVSIEDNEVDLVVDIGGGYGNMARIARKLGYVGRWVIVDFPIMLEIQAKYLSDHGITDVEFAEANTGECFAQGGTSILIGCYSVSEMPMDDRQRLEKQYEHFEYLFFMHNDFHGGISNLVYFHNLKTLLEYQGFRVDWFPDQCRQGNHTSHWFMLAGHE